MDEQHALQRVFSEELSELERFRIGYLGEQPGLPLRSDDPDIMRLLEALALFSARTRLASERSVQRSLTRLFLQQFPYLLTPMPAMGMVQATPTHQLADVAQLPAGEPLELTLATGPTTLPTQPNLGGARLQLATTRALRVLPMRLKCLDSSEDSRQRLVLLRLESTIEHIDEVEELAFYIDHAELKASLSVFHELRQHLRAVHVAYDVEAVERLRGGTACEFSFGAALECEEHPLQELRSFFHFPEQLLYLRVRVPPHRGRAYSSVLLQLDLGSAFPADLMLSARSFALNVTPVKNVRRLFSSAVDHDATQERVSLRSPDPEQRYRPLEVKAVYRIDEVRGLVPLAVSHLLEGDDSYDLDFEGQGAERCAYLSVVTARHFFEPARLVADVVWYQPTLAYEAHRATLSCAERALSGVQLSTRGALRNAAEPSISAREALVTVLGLRSRPLLTDAGELRSLLDCLGAADSPQFAPLVAAIRSCTAIPRPSRTGSQGLRYDFEIVCKGVDRSRMASLTLFGDQLLALLSCWSVEEISSLTLVLPELDLSLRYADDCHRLGRWRC